MKNFYIKIILSGLVLLVFSTIGFAQTTAFNYQGRLTDIGNPANGNYQLEFKLFDAVAGGAQIGGSVSDVAVTAAQGVFNTQLDFGANVFTGADRFLEIAVRRNAGEAYITLNPRQQIASSPYSIRTLSAAQADVALDSQKLGGIVASEYVTTTSVGNSFIKNATTQQTGANFNISGNGFFGGNVGIGTFTPATKLEVRTPTSAYGFTQTDGTVSVGSFVSTQGGWYGTRSNHPLYLFTNNGGATMTINTIGNVGIGTINPNARLQVVGATNDVGIFSQANASASARGVQGESTLGTGVLGNSTSGFGVLGRSSAANTSTISGVFGQSTGSGGIGVIGEANSGGNAFGVYGTSTNGYGVVGNSTSGPAVTGISTTNRGVVGQSISFDGVYGLTNSSTGAGVSGRNTGGGLAMYADGNAKQERNKGGWVKAMVYVNEDGTIARCFNALTNSSTGNCGFSINRPIVGVYNIDFGFQVDDRFCSVSAVRTSGANVAADFSFSGPNIVGVSTFYTDSHGLSYTNGSFMLIVY